MFSLLSLLDEVATTLDDVAVMSKVAIKKTSAIMSDDLAVNAGVVVDVKPDRELPIVKSIFWGSLLNKVYCIVGVLLLGAIYPPLIKIVLVIGGLYLCFEGVHKVVEKLLHGNEQTKERAVKVSEKDKIKGAIRTDFILSIEIIVIAKSTLSGSFVTQLVSLIVVGILASILIYGLVALIVKIDDFGLVLIAKKYKRVGSVFVRSMPYIMKGLGIVGTLAMLLVGGGIISHTFHFPHWLNEYLQNMIVGIVTGFICLGAFELFNKLRSKPTH